MVTVVGETRVTLLREIRVTLMGEIRVTLMGKIRVTLVGVIRVTMQWGLGLAGGYWEPQGVGGTSNGDHLDGHFAL